MSWSSIISIALMVGCGNDHPSEPAVEVRHSPLVEMTAFKDAMCGCKNAACVTRVNDEMGVYAKEQVRLGAPRPTLTPEEQTRSIEISDQATRCIKAAMATASPSDAQRYVAKNAELKDRLCACKDIACAEAVAAELTRWSEDFLAHPNDSSTMSAEDQERMTTIEHDIGTCMRSLRR